MSDLVERLQNWIASLKASGYVVLHDYGSHTPSNCLLDLVKAVEQLESLQAENAELRERLRWRKVEDERPSSETGYVIGWLPEFPGGMLCSLTVTPRDELWPYVTHWMPLPEPPPEEQE